MDYRAATAELKTLYPVLRIHNLTWHYYRQWWHNGSMDVLLLQSVHQPTTVRGVLQSCERKATATVFAERMGLAEPVAHGPKPEAQNTASLSTAN
jgi:hypothetical protein